MPASQARHHAAPGDWSVAPTFAWFVLLLAGAMYGLGIGFAGVRGLIDRKPGAADDEVGPAVAGPGFVQRESERAQLPTGDEIDDEYGLEDDDQIIEDIMAGGTVADGHRHDPDAVKVARTPLEDVCIDGTAEACRRWAMDGFYDALDRGSTGDGLIRLSLWGDSVTAEGYIAEGMRGKLARTYGDGGAGFVFLAKPSRWYRNTAVRQTQSDGWMVHSIVHPRGVRDGLHGYGGAEFVGTAGDRVSFRTAKVGPGSKVSRFELYYLASPSGGTATIAVDDEVVRTIDTGAATTTSGFAAVDVADGHHELEIRVTSGRVRFYGVTMERAAGVVVDSLGIVSNSTKKMTKLRAAHWHEQLAHRDADLMMVLLGTNEVGEIKGKRVIANYRVLWNKLLSQVRKGNPDGTCMVIGTLDAGELIDGRKYVGHSATIDPMLAVQRAAAVAHGCAFWDSRAYMGGKDSARRWYKKGLMSGDFEHLTKKGGKVLGSGIVEALESGYALSKSR